jgi:hypothetical protein
MADRGILFSAPMVRAILEGRKTQTRRPLYVLTKNIARACFDLRYQPPAHLPPLSTGYTLSAWRNVKAGDRLWGRERGWRARSGLAFLHYVGNELSEPPTSPDGTPYKPCPSIHMPRWACRLELDVTADARVERLRAITEEDAIAEGIQHSKFAPGYFAVPGLSQAHYLASAREAYAGLWTVINGEDGPMSWAANPWVVVITFQRRKT